MRVVPIDENGKKRSPFTHQDQPKPAVVGKCARCGGGLRAEDYTSWTEKTGHVHKRIYRCVQSAWKCPSITVTIGPDGQEEETMAKRPGMTFSQTPEWCDRTKEAMKAKHLAYKDVAKAAAISQSALAQGLTMRMSLCVDTQERIEKAIAAANPEQAQKTRKERASRKPKVEPSPVVESKEALPAAGLTPPPPGYDAVDHYRGKQRVGAKQKRVFLTEKCPVEIQAAMEKAVKRVLDDDGQPVEVRSVGPGELHEGEFNPPKPTEWSGPLIDRVNAICERAEERYKAFSDGHQLHENRLGYLELARVEMLHEQEQVDADNARRFQELEDRITESHNHLSEQMAGLPLVAAPLAPEPVRDMVFNWNYEGLTFPNRVAPEDLLSELAKMTPEQVTALVAAATARREFFKTLEAA